MENCFLINVFYIITGSIGYLFQPLGSILSVFITGNYDRKIKVRRKNLSQLSICTDPLGRKRSMIFVNIPLALGWFLVYQGDVFWKILTGCAFLGLGIGLMESPVTTYLGEIWFNLTFSKPKLFLKLKISPVIVSVSHRLVVFS